MNDKNSQNIILTDSNPKKETVKTLNRPTEPLPIPKDPQGRLTYTSEQVEAYRAVLFGEAIRSLSQLPEGKKIQRDVNSLVSAAGGVSGKSALLNRIASGLWPLVVPPPLAMSYPWYEVVESDKPIELWLEAGNAKDLIKQGGMHSNAFAKGADAKRVLIEQSLWDVEQVIDDVTLDVTKPAWKDLGFVWRVSIDKILASDADQFMLSWHDPAIGRITTLAQLVKEKSWHINKCVNEMRTALSQQLTEIAMAEAIKKDEVRSRFHQISLEQSLAANLAVVRSRLLVGKSEVPEAEEIEQMIQLDVEKTFSKTNRWSWYSAGAEGELYVHTWRIRRLLPTVLDESIYMDVEQLVRQMAAVPEDLKKNFLF